MCIEFSSSSRVTTFLSTVSRYRVHVRHIDGVANLSDLGSRNPCECQNTNCQVCKFIEEMEELVVPGVLSDFIDGSVKMRFTGLVHLCSLDSRDAPFQEDDQSGRC